MALVVLKSEICELSLVATSGVFKCDCSLYVIVIA